MELTDFLADTDGKGGEEEVKDNGFTDIHPPDEAIIPRPLTDDDKKRIAENREKALRKKQRLNNGGKDDDAS